MANNGCSHCEHCNTNNHQQESIRNNSKKQYYKNNSKKSSQKNSGLKKSASSFLNRHNNHCMCQVCTCQKPEHKCPINYIHKNFNGITNYQREYIPHKLERNSQYRMRDNLKSKKKFMNGTEYQNAYKNRKNKNDKHKNHDKEVKEMIYHNNAKSHIKDLMGRNKRNKYSNSERNYERVKSANNRPLNNYQQDQSHFYQPSKFVKPEKRKLQRKKMETKTAYQKDYQGYKPSKKNYSKINYDNLIVGNPDFRFKGTTEYRDKHKSPQNYTKKNKNDNDNMYKMIRNANNMTHAIHGDYKNKGKTEYQRNYTEKKVKLHNCPMNDLPKVREDLKNMPNHVYFHKSKRDWAL